MLDVVKQSFLRSMVDEDMVFERLVNNYNSNRGKLSARIEEEE